MLKSTVERAFELARSGRCADIATIKRLLMKEGYSQYYIQGKALLKQLRGEIKLGGFSSIARQKGEASASTLLIVADGA